MKAGRETVCLKHRRGGSASISRRLLRARGLLPPASSLAGLHPHPVQQPGPVRSVPTAPLVANPHSPHSSLLVLGRASTLGPLLLSGRPYGTAALNATPRQWLPHAYRRIRNLCGISPSYRLFPPENPSRVFNEPRGLNADSAELPPSPHLGDWQLGCSSCAGRTPPSRGASRWLPTADSLTFRSPVTLTTSCGPLSPLAWPLQWPYFRVTQKPARTFRPSLVPDAMSSRLRRVGVKPIPRVESPTRSKWDPRADSEPQLSATFYFEILPYCANKARPACWRGTTIVPGKVAPHQPTARGPANMSDGPFEVS